MNCHRAQQLVSPYLDQQLTGAEMMEMQHHLAGCRRCAQDYREARQTKLLLRSLSLSQPPRALETRIISRIAQDGRGVFPSLPSAALPTWSLPGVGPAPRGRRLVTALGLSCLVVLSVAGPFAPSSADIATQNHAASASLGPGLVWAQFPSAATLPAPASLARMPSLTADVSAVSLAGYDVPSRRDATLARQYVQPPLSEPDAEPLGDDAVSGYVSGGVVLAGFSH